MQTFEIPCYNVSNLSDVGPTPQFLCAKCIQKYLQY